MLRLMTACLALTVSGPAFSAEWEEFHRTSEATFFVNRSTLVRDGGEIRVWVTANYSVEQKGHGWTRPYRSARFLYVIDCPALIALSQAIYEHSGKVVGEASPIIELKKPPAGGHTDKIRQLVCKASSI